MPATEIRESSGSPERAITVCDLSLYAPEVRGYADYFFRTYGRRFEYVLGLVRQFSTGPEILDVGNFPGHFSVLAQTSGYVVSGVDIKPDRAVDLWRAHGIPEFQIDVEREPLPFSDASFDVVVFTEVLEHLRVDPILAVRECGRVLRPSGVLVLGTPNVSPRHRIRFFFGKDYQGDIISAFRTLETVGHMGHFRLYSRGEILAILNYVGLVPIAIRRAGSIAGGKWAFTKALWPVRDFFRSHLYVVARKPASRASDT